MDQLLRRILAFVIFLVVNWIVLTGLSMLLAAVLGRVVRDGPSLHRITRLMAILVLLTSFILAFYWAFVAFN